MHKTVAQIFILIIYFYKHIANAQSCNNEPFVIETNNATLFNISSSGSCWCNNYIGNGSQLLLTQNTYLLDTIIILNNTIQQLNNTIQQLKASLELKYLTSPQRDNLTALNGTTIYNTDNKIMEGYINGKWQPLNHPTVILTQNVQQLISPGIDTQISLSIMSVYDNTNVFNASSANLTVLLSGTYLICGSAVFPSSNATRVTYFISVNNTRTFESNFLGSNAISTEFFITGHLHIEANTIIYAGIYHTASSAQYIGQSSIYGVQLQPKLSVELISYS